MVWVVGIQAKLVGFLRLCCHLLLKRSCPQLHNVLSATTSELHWGIHISIVSLL